VKQLNKPFSPPTTAAIQMLSPIPLNSSAFPRGGSLGIYRYNISRSFPLHAVTVGKLGLKSSM